LDKDRGQQAIKAVLGLDNKEEVCEIGNAKEKFVNNTCTTAYVRSMYETSTNGRYLSTVLPLPAVIVADEYVFDMNCGERRTLAVKPENWVFAR
jgi:hypothetical protein